MQVGGGTWSQKEDYSFSVQTRGELHFHVKCSSECISCCSSYLAPKTPNKKPAYTKKRNNTEGPFMVISSGQVYMVRSPRLILELPGQEPPMLLCQLLSQSRPCPGRALPERRNPKQNQLRTCLLGTIWSAPAVCNKFYLSHSN